MYTVQMWNSKIIGFNMIVKCKQSLSEKEFILKYCVCVLIMSVEVKLNCTFYQLLITCAMQTIAPCLQHIVMTDQQTFQDWYKFGNSVLVIQFLKALGSTARYF